MFTTKLITITDPVKLTKKDQITWWDQHNIEKYLDNFSYLWEKMEPSISPNVKETPEKYVLELELPRKTKKDIVLSFSNDYLFVKVNSDIDSTIYMRNVDVEKITSMLKLGLLTVTCPKLNINKLKKVKKIIIDGD